MEGQLVLEYWRESCVKERKQILYSGCKRDLNKSAPEWWQRVISFFEAIRSDRPMH
jgi:hypothetical protein